MDTEHSRRSLATYLPTTFELHASYVSIIPLAKRDKIPMVGSDR